jgi:hypothetical protein
VPRDSESYVRAHVAITRAITPLSTTPPYRKKQCEAPLGAESGKTNHSLGRHDVCPSVVTGFVLSQLCHGLDAPKASPVLSVRGSVRAPVPQTPHSTRRADAFNNARARVLHLCLALSVRGQHSSLGDHATQPASGPAPNLPQSPQSSDRCPGAWRRLNSRATPTSSLTPRLGAGPRDS